MRVLALFYFSMPRPASRMHGMELAQICPNLPYFTPVVAHSCTHPKCLHIKDGMDFVRDGPLVSFEHMTIFIQRGGWLGMTEPF